MNKRNFLLPGIGIGLVILIIVAGIIYLSISRFATNVNPPHQAPGAIATARPTSTATANSSPDLQTFQIAPAQTTAAYSVFENLIFQNKPNNDAIGTTHSVSGNFRIRTTGTPLIEGMNITVDLRTLQSDSRMRDNYVRRNTLETDTYPTATFVSVSSQGLPSTYSDGQIVHFQLTGNLTMHGKTNKEVFDVQGKVSGNTVTGTATSTVFMTDFGMQPPNLANIAIAQNKVVLTLNFTANKG